MAQPQCGRPGFDPWVGKIPWRRAWQPTPGIWPGEFHGLCIPHDHKESDTTLSLSQGAQGFPGGSDGKESACNAGDLGLIPGLGRCPGEGHGNPFQYSCLENPHGQRRLAGYSPWGRKRTGRDLATKPPSPKRA